MRLVHSFWLDNRPWVVTVLAYAAFSVVFTAALGYPLLGSNYMRQILAPSFGLIVVGMSGFVIYALMRYRPDSPFALIRERNATWRLEERVVAGLAVAVLLQLFMMCFVSVKLGIPQLVPFYLDPWLKEADEVLHGGPAWKLVEPLFGSPNAGRVMDHIYALWFMVFYVSVLSAAMWLEGGKLRAQFLLAFFLTWILLGTVLALPLSSVGPCFYGLFYPGTDPYADKMALLRATDAVAPLPALKLQDALYVAVSTQDRSFPFGISAMPSLHVAIATLLALMACKVNRWLGVAGVLFATTIMVGSVYLAWHYALDGYVSIVCVLGIWVIAGWVVDRDRGVALVPSAAPAE